MPDYGTNCYNGTGGRCSSGPQPGTIALRAGVRAVYPGIGDLGIFNCRPSSGGGGLSTHGEGRGWDAACNATNPAGLALGNRLAADLVKHYSELGIQRIIWNRKQTDVPNGMGNWRTYGGQSPHVDHLHIETCWKAARDNPLTVEYVKQVLGEEDWFTLATKEELAEVVEAALKDADHLVIQVVKNGAKTRIGIDVVVKELAKRAGIIGPGDVWTP